MRIRVDERIVEGTPLQIVQTMRSIEFGASASDADYMRGVAAKMAQFGRTCDLDGPSDEDNARALVDAMLAAGLVTKE